MAIPVCAVLLAGLGCESAGRSERYVLPAVGRRVTERTPLTTATIGVSRSGPLRTGIAPNATSVGYDQETRITGLEAARRYVGRDSSTAPRSYSAGTTLQPGVTSTSASYVGTSDNASVVGESTGGGRVAGVAP